MIFLPHYMWAENNKGGPFRRKTIFYEIHIDFNVQFAGVSQDTIFFAQDNLEFKEQA